MLQMAFSTMSILLSNSVWFSHAPRGENRAIAPQIFKNILKAPISFLVVRYKQQITIVLSSTKILAGWSHGLIYLENSLNRIEVFWL